MSDEKPVCGAVCADDPKREYPCVEPQLHSRSHKDSRGWTWAVSNEEMANSPELSHGRRAQAAARAACWHARIAVDVEDNDDMGIFDDE